MNIRVRLLFFLKVLIPPVRDKLISVTTVRSKSEQFQLVGYLRSKGFGFGHSKGLI